MRVYLNHVPGNIHPVYQEMLDHPPEEVEFINAEDFGKQYQNTAKKPETHHGFFPSAKDRLILFLKRIYVLPNITFRRLPGDIIYSCQAIPLFGEYVLDIDCYEALNRFSNAISDLSVNKWIVRMFLRQKRCKKIVFWSEAARKSFQSYLGSEFDEKTVVLYPGIYVRHELKTILALKSETFIDIVVIAKDFIYKSGEEILEAATKLLQAHENIRFTVIGNVDARLQSKYSHPRIAFVGLIERKRVLEILSQSHIFLLPTFIDIFGYAFLEAYAYGLVCIGGDGFATKEIIDGKVDGFMVEGYSRNLFDRTTYRKNGISLDTLILTRNTHERSTVIQDIFEATNRCINGYSQYKDSFLPIGFEKVRSGKFSIESRNRQLVSILSQ